MFPQPKKLLIVRREGKDIIVTCQDEKQAIEIFNAMKLGLSLQQEREDQIRGFPRNRRVLQG